MIAWNANTKNWCVCLSVCVCVCVTGRVGEKERGKLTWELTPFGGNANALCKTQLRWVISNIPECSGSGEGGEGREGRKEETQQHGGRRGLGCHLCLPGCCAA